MNHSDVSKDRIRGWLNVPLDPEGKKEAKRIGEYLEDKNIDKIYYSDLVRTAETANIIDKYLKVKCYDDKGLRPWNLGELQGQISKNVSPEIDAYMKNGKSAPKD